MTIRPFLLAFTALALPLAFHAPLHAQTSAPASAPIAAEDIAATDGGEVPLHPAYVTGTLPNGVRYMVRRNAEPKGRLSIRVHLKVGGLMEEDDEQGWAHLLEHMLFRGTKNFPDGEGEKTWQRLGARPGSHSNAFTSYASTRYVLDIGRADGEALDEALAVLADMLDQADIDKDILAKEQKIVLAERAMRMSEAESRIQSQRLRFYQPNGRAGTRNLIGSAETLEAATAKTLRKFYDRWYRPERATVVIVGDGDPAAMVASINKAFGKWRGVGKPGKEVPAAPVPVSPPAATIVEPHYTDNWELLWQRPSPTGVMTVARREDEIIDAIALMIVNERLRDDIERTTQIVRAGVSEQRNNALTPRRLSLSIQMDADGGSAEAGPALNQAYRVVKGAMGGVRQDEVDEQWRNLDRIYRQAIDRDTKAQSPDLADVLVASFDPQSTIADPRYSAAMLTRLKPSLTAERLTQRLQQLFGQKPRAIYLSSKPPTGGVASVETMLAQAMAEQVPVDTGLAAISLDALQLPEGKAKIVGQSKIDDLAISRTQLSNGVEIAMRPNDQLVNQLSVRVKLGRGLIARPINDPGLFWTARALGQAGYGPFDRTALQRIGAGRQILPQFYFDTDGVVLTVNTTREDMADAMKLMVSAITQMRYDETSVRRFQSGLKTGYRNYLTDPASVMSAMGAPYRFGGDSRFRSIPSILTINTLTPDSFRRFWSDELTKGPVKVSIVGDFDQATTFATAMDLFGRLQPTPTQPPQTERTALKATPDKGKSLATLYHLGDPDRAMAMLVYPTVSSDDDLQAARAVQLTTHIVRQRLAEGFRAQQAGTYASNVTTYTNRSLPKYGAFIVSTELKPELIPAFQDAVRAIMVDLAANGPSADSFARARNPMLAEIEVNRKTNAYWTQVLDDSLDDPKIVAAVRSYISGRASLTPKDIQQIARLYLAGTEQTLPAQAFQIQVLPTPKKETQTASPAPTQPVTGKPADSDKSSTKQRDDAGEEAEALDDQL